MQITWHNEWLNAASTAVSYGTVSVKLVASLLQDGTQKSQKVFVNIPTEVGATEAEEIGASFCTMFPSF